MHHPPNLRTWRRGNGLILIVLIAIVIIAVVLVGGNSGGYLGTVQKSRETAEAAVSEITVQQLVTELVGYHGSNGEFPENMDELLGPGRGNDYVDLWGEPLRLEVVEERGQRALFIITSAGEDGYWDTEDDQRFERTSPI